MGGGGGRGAGVSRSKKGTIVTGVVQVSTVLGFSAKLHTQPGRFLTILKPGVRVSPNKNLPRHLHKKSYGE